MKNKVKQPVGKAVKLKLWIAGAVFGLLSLQAVGAQTEPKSVPFVPALVSAQTAKTAEATTPQWQRITSLAEPSQYLQNFPHYSYVNSHAPKTGTLNRVIIGSFNSLNPYIIEGQPPMGLAPFGGGMLYETLMDQSLEEDGVFYPALAEALQYPADDSWVKFRLNPKARWHDGRPITADDVVWSFHLLRKISPYYSSYYAEVAKVEKTATGDILFTFKHKGNRELPKIMGDLVVLPRHWWEGTDSHGKRRDITKPTLEIPLGSGPYRIKKIIVGKSVIWQRVPNAWGAILPQNIGRNNFEIIRDTYMLDSNAEWEAFKKGGFSDYRIENIISRWENGYNFSAVRQGAVKKMNLPYYGGLYQAFYFNMRRSKFADIRVREALTLALDFNTINKVLFYNKYQRTESYYGRQKIAQNGVPQGRERQLLEQMRASFPSYVPPQVFMDTFSLPVYRNPGDNRRYLDKAMQLLKAAGWHLHDNQLVNRNGQIFSMEFLFPSADIARPAALYIANLQKLGIQATIRIIDRSQYANRLNNFDFDAMMSVCLQSSSPGNEQADYFGTIAAQRAGSRNYAGIKNPAVDSLTTHLIHAETRDEVVATARAIDLVLLWNYYSVPLWQSPHFYLSYWDKFGIPKTQPRHTAVDIFSWWVDKDKERALEKMGYNVTGNSGR